MGKYWGDQRWGAGKNWPAGAKKAAISLICAKTEETYYGGL